MIFARCGARPAGGTRAKINTWMARGSLIRCELGVSDVIGCDLSAYLIGCNRLGSGGLRQRGAEG